MYSIDPYLTVPTLASRDLPLQVIKMPKAEIQLPQSVSLKKHWQTWNDCQRCSLCKTRDHLAVLYRWHRPLGKTDQAFEPSVPADVLFIGEAPGESEDLTGHPFTGPSGGYLSRTIRDAQENTNTHTLKILFTNILACIPLNGTEVRPPNPSEVEACRPRLEEFIVSTQPTAIVAVGKIASRYFPHGFKKAFKTFWFVEHTLEIIHPAALLRSLPSMRDAETSKIRLKLERLFTELENARRQSRVPS